MYWYILAAHIFSCLTFIGDLRCSKMYLHFRKRLLRGKERVLLLRWAAAHGWWMILAATRVSELFSAQMCCYGFRKILRSRSSYCCCKMCLLSLSAAAAISSSYTALECCSIYYTFRKTVYSSATTFYLKDLFQISLFGFSPTRSSRGVGRQPLHTLYPV